MFKRILIANRGEIARRIIRTCQQMGVETVAVYSDSDRTLPFVKEADIAYALHGYSAADTYLDIDKVLNAARETGAEAIHPGYGFLSENARFAHACEHAGIVFIGPSPHAIELMGDKAAARLHMIEHQVPVLPGFDQNPATDAQLEDAAQSIGFPLLIKAVAGGGGKGMRIVNTLDAFSEALAGARREAKAAFGDDRVLLEKYLPTARHVEVQVFADQHNQAIHLFERDCSIQRRHQKIIEEAPAPGLTDQTRQKMGEAAVRACQSIGYCGAGTVEFLLTPDDQFYFMEMNTRLQVEHPVTELITGLDLVKWQLQVASGAPLPARQDDIHVQGHAMEVRVYAESPQKGFLPSTGTLHIADWPDQAAHGIRVDSGYQQGDTISELYDPMIAKLISHGDNREEARTRLLQGIHHTRLAGVEHNLPFLSAILQMEAFIATELDTRFLDKHSAPIEPDHTRLLEQQALIASAVWLANQHSDNTRQDPWNTLSGWRTSGLRQWHYSMALNGQDYLVTLESQTSPERATPHYRCTLNHTPLEIEFDLPGAPVADSHVTLRHQQTLYPWIIEPLDDHLMQQHHGRVAAFFGEQPFLVTVSPVTDAQFSEDASSAFKAPMSGTVVSVHAAAGDTVDAGAAVITMEAMKMEHTLRAPTAGRIQHVHFEPGNTVKEGTLLIDFIEEEGA